MDDAQHAGQPSLERDMATDVLRCSTIQLGWQKIQFEIGSDSLILIPVFLVLRGSACHFMFVSYSICTTGSISEAAG